MYDRIRCGHCDFGNLVVYSNDGDDSNSDVYMHGLYIFFVL